MSSEAEICNLALSHLGIGKEIANLTTESSQEAQACRRFFDIARDKTLRGFNWSFICRTEDLALVEEDPTVEWAYSYRYPTNAIKIRRIFSGIRNDNRQSRVPYRVVSDDAGLLIYTDMQNATIEYSLRTDDTSKYPSDFVLALSYLLGFYTATRLTGGDPFGLKKYCGEMFRLTISEAAAGDLGEQQDEEEPQSEAIRAREG